MPSLRHERNFYSIVLMALVDLFGAAVGSLGTRTML